MCPYWATQRVAPTMGLSNSPALYVANNLKLDAYFVCNTLQNQGLQGGDPLRRPPAHI